MNSKRSKPLLIIHIGTPKTGTTALQNFLKNNQSLLLDHGVNFVQAGRSNISHNVTSWAIKQKDAAKTLIEIEAEIMARPDLTHVLSSELFFRPFSAKAFSEHLSQDLITQTKIVCYLRRQDKYLEALYKQHVKNGRVLPGSADYLERRRNGLIYSVILNTFSDVFKTQNMIVRPFEKDTLHNSDIVEDFFHNCGIEIPPEASRLGTSANRTPSIEVSELLGMLRLSTTINSRHVLRKVIEMKMAGAIRSNDVYDLATRRDIVQFCQEDTEKIRQQYCPDIGSLFNMVDLELSEPPIPQSDVDPETRWRAAALAIFKAIGALEK